MKQQISGLDQQFWKLLVSMTDISDKYVQKKFVFSYSVYCYL